VFTFLVKFEGAPLFSLFMPYLAFFALLFFKNEEDLNFLDKVIKICINKLVIMNKVLSIIYYLLSIIYYLLSIIYYLLSIIYYLLSIIYYGLLSLISSCVKTSTTVKIYSFSLLLILCFSIIFISFNNSFIFENVLKDEVLSKIISFESLHFTNCYKQGLDTSCGIATTATFLRFFYNISLDEKKLIEQFFEYTCF